MPLIPPPAFGFVTIQNNILLKPEWQEYEACKRFVTIQNNILLKLHCTNRVHTAGFVTIQNNILLKLFRYESLYMDMFCYHSK